MLLAAGIQSGDEVITSPFAFIAATHAIIGCSARPKFVDVHPKTLNLDPAALEAAITPKTRVILASPSAGNAGGMEEIEQLARKHELLLLENASETFAARIGGRPAGSYGRASCFSFHIDKQITTGEGGMIVTDDDRFAELCRSIRNHGRNGHANPAHVRLGFSYRMGELAAAMGLAQLTRLTEITETRRRLAQEYFRRLMENRYVSLPTIPEETQMCWGTFTLRLNDLFEPGDRDEIIRLMAAEGVETGRRFSAIHLQPHIAAECVVGQVGYPVAEYMAERTLSLPLHCRLSGGDIERICQVLDLAIEHVLMGRCKPRF